jgi:hypothetical protein
MPAPPYVPTRQQMIDVFNNSMFYEILFTFGVPVHDPNDYCNWEAINFNRMAHARLLYDFIEQPVAQRYKDNVLAEDFGYVARPIPLPPDDRKRLNKDLMHFTYDRLRHTPATKPWPSSILACLHDPIVGFMKHVKTQADLFPSPGDASFWERLIEYMESGRQIIISCALDAGKRPTYHVRSGQPLPSGKAALTTFGRPL